MSEPAPSHVPRSTLATPEQAEAEATLRAMLEDPLVVAAMEQHERRLSQTAIGRTPDGAARLATAVRAWTGQLVMRWLAGDPGRPAILLTTDNTPRDWFGPTTPPTGSAADNPDHIYRNTFLDGRGRWLIEGRLDLDRPPAQFSIEVVRGLPGKLSISSAAAGVAMKSQIDLITADLIEHDADGTFTLRLDGDASSAPNHLATAPEPLTLIIRDVLSDWHQGPTALRLRRADPAADVPSTVEDLRSRVLADLPDFLDFWSQFPLSWMGGIAPNASAPPVPRDGGWGYQASVRYLLGPGELMLITARRGGAGYLGVQACDPWLLSPDARRHLTSLNTAQAVPDEPDSDAYTYAVSAEDPGVANWLDTDGSRSGITVLRWAAVATAQPGEDLLVRAQVMDRATLDLDHPHLARVTREQREAQRAAHAAEHALRYR